MNFGQAVYEIARKEAMQLVRTKRALVLAILFIVFMVLLTIVVPNIIVRGFGESIDDNEWFQNEAFFLYLNASLAGGYSFVSLMAILFTADSVSSEWQRRQIFLVLSKPVSRTAFAVGKLLGTAIPLVIILAGSMLLVYGLQTIFLPGAPSPEAFLHFLAAIGFLALGAAIFASMALFFSTLTRSTLVSFLLSFAAIFFVFPLLGGIGDIAYLVDSEEAWSQGTPEPDDSAWKYDWSHYLDPGRIMAKAGDVLTEEETGFALSFLLPSQTPERLGLTIVAGIAWVAAYLGMAVWMVNRRNFE